MSRGREQVQVARLDARDGEHPPVWDWCCSLCDEGAADDQNDLTWQQAMDLAWEHASSNFHLLNLVRRA